MYLNILSNKEKEDFLELAYYAMSLDGKFKEVEKKMYINFQSECQMSSYKVNKQSDISKIYVSLQKSPKKIKKIVLIELLGILLSDKEYSKEEEDFINLLGKQFDVQEYQLARMQRWVEAFNDLISEGFLIIS